MKTLPQRKKTLKNVIKKNYSECSTLAYLLIHTGKLDNVIKKLNNKIAITDTNCIIKKGFLTSEEQFVSVLEHIIYRMNTYFWFLTTKNTIIELILNYEETEKLLLSKKYVGNNSYISFYDFYTKRSCVSSFYKLLKSNELNSTTISKFLTSHKIDINTIDIDNEQDIEKLFKILRLICICNYNSYQLFYLFNDKIEAKNKIMYQYQLETLIERTIKRQNQVKTLLNY